MLKNSLITLAAIIVWLFIFEGLSKIWVNTWGNPYQRSLEILKADPRYGWIQKPNLNKNFYGAKVHTNSSGFRNEKNMAELLKSQSLIIAFGPSSAFGWGVENEAIYTQQLAQKMTSESGRKYEALNLSQIGYSSYQGQLLSETPGIQEVRPEVAIFAFGVNDVDRHRFFFQSPKTDFEELTSPQISTGQLSLINFINGSSFLRLLSTFTSAALLNFDCTSLQQIPARRLSLAETEGAFTKLAQKYKQLNSRVVLITTPHHYQDIDPHMKLDYTELFAASVAAAKEGNCGAAKALAIEGRKMEKNIIVRDIIELNQILKAAANRLGVVLVDAEELLKEERYFLDPIHPNKEGHQLIATRIFDELKDKAAKSE